MELVMNDIEKQNERVKAAKEAFEFVQHSAVHDRKFSKDGHGNGHYVTALNELKKIIDHEVSILERLQARA